MQFDSRFTVTGTPQAVIAQFADVPLMAGFLPGASVEAPNEDGTWPATLVASFGPKKIAFKGTLANRVDAAALAGVLSGQASADVRGARMAVTMTYSLAPAPQGTEVRLSSDAQLSGVLAEFARTGGVIVAEALIAEFARRFSDHMQALSAGEAAPVPSKGATTLSMGAVLLAVLRRLKSLVWRTA